MNPYTQRLDKLRRIVEEENACGLFIQKPANMYYALGYSGAGALLVTKDGSVLLVPPLEYLRARDTLVENNVEAELIVFQPYKLPRGLDLGGKPKVIDKPLVEAVSNLVEENCTLLHDGLNTASYDKLSRRFRLADVSQHITELRSVKEWWELERIEAATRIAEEALATGLNTLDDNVSEAEIAATIEYTMRRLGASQTAFPTIVAFGRNSIYPHAEPSLERRLRRDTVVLIDLGAVYKGYRSDMTRTTVFGVDKSIAEVADVVMQAVDEAIDSIEPGKTCEEIDAVARQVLARHGLDKYFIHSLGHGVGIEVHEEPRVSPGSKKKLREGMVITVEPGVYIPGQFGVRIEELVVVTKKGARRITRFPSRLWE